MSFDDGDAASGRGGGSASGSGMNRGDPFFALIYGRDVSVLVVAHCAVLRCAMRAIITSAAVIAVCRFSPKSAPRSSRWWRAEACCRWGRLARDTRLRPSLDVRCSLRRRAGVFAC
jgi:hypothetical protein